MVKIFLLILAGSILIIAQTNNQKAVSGFTGSGEYESRYQDNKPHFEVGIRDELILIESTDLGTNKPSFYKTDKSVPPYNVHLTAGLRFMKYDKIDLRFGMMADFVNILGLDEQVSFQINFLKSRFYAELSAEFFNNNLISNSNPNKGQRYTFYCIGLGYEASKHIDVDISYCIPDGKILNSKYTFGGTDLTSGNINYMIKLGCEYSFIF